MYVEYSAFTPPVKKDMQRNVTPTLNCLDCHHSIDWRCQLGRGKGRNGKKLIHSMFNTTMLSFGHDQHIII